MTPFSLRDDHFNAVYLSIFKASDPADAIRGLFDINVMGVLNTLLPAIEPMRRRRKGQLAVVSSLTAYWSFNPYAATKACLVLRFSRHTLML